MPNYVEFEYRITDNDGFKKLGISAEDFDAAVKRVTDDVNGLNGSLVNMSQKAQLLQGVTDVIGKLHSSLRSLTDAYTVQETAEIRLAQVMRNTMNASDEEIESIKRLAAEQQKLGVVGDEVQLNAAQELATYLEFSDSLKTIMPVMNDMIAQQMRLGASAEEAAQIATMLGKVMNGQTEALSRYGYKFDDAQKEILKFGEESERAALLVEVIGASVGGVNAAFGNTPLGKLQQMTMTLGDAKEQVGALVIKAMPAISAMADLAMTASGIAQLTTALKGLNAQQALASSKSVLLAGHMRMQSVAAKILGVSERSAAVATGALKTQILALEGVLTAGLAVAIYYVVDGLSRLIGKSHDAADAVEDIDEAADAYKQTSSRMRSELAMQIVELEDLIKRKGKEQAKVEELNRTYGDAFGTYSTAADWYDTLKKKSADYCKQLGYEAKAKVYAAKSGEKQVELDELRKKMKEYEDAGNTAESTTITTQASGNWGATSMSRTIETEYGRLKREAAALEAEVSELDGEFLKCVSSAKALADSIQSEGDDSKATISWRKMNLGDLTKQIQEQEKTLRSLAGTEDKVGAAAAAAELKRMKARKDALEKAYGLDGGKGKKNEYDGSSFIENAATFEEVTNNVKYYENAIKSADASDQDHIETLVEQKLKWEEIRQEIQRIIDQSSRPASLDTLDDIDKEINYQKELRKTASKEALAGIDAEIKRLNALKTAFEDAAHADIPVDQIKTYEQLESELGFYEAKLKTASVEERADIQKRIKGLTDLKEKWDDLLVTMSAPGDISTLSTLEDLDNAIAYYSARQKKASAEEVAGIQQTIAALEAKKAKLNNIISLSGMQSEMDDLSGLSGNRLRFELELVGLEGVKSKIASLQKMLDDTKNPLDASQRAQVETLIASWEKYQLTLQKSNVTIADGWNNIKGIGNSVENLTETLKGDGDAWDKVSAVIDNTLALYQSFAGIIEIIKALTTVTNAHTVATEAKGAAEATAAAETVAAAATTVAADASVATAENTKATASVTAAAAETMSAHAAIPFAGIAIGAALVGTLLAVMASLPKFANGGIAYGPTLGLFGEYAGASNNPEVVAPLDKLRSLIGTPYGFGGGTVEFKIRDRELVGILKKSYNRIDRVK